MRNQVILYICLMVMILTACSEADFDGDVWATQTDNPFTTASASPPPTLSTPDVVTDTPRSEPVGNASPTSADPASQPFTPTALPTVGPVYMLQAGTPLELKNFIDTSAGCDWMGIGGQVFDLDGIPMTEFILEVGGYLGDDEIMQMGITGDTPSLGPGGYSIKLSDQPFSSEDSLWLQLFGLNGHPLSETVYFSTHQDCDKNFILINFVKVPPGYGLQAVIPLILKNTPIP
ncbi:MAG: hypothetical protein PVF74_12635 [Anaerolineales bacterium]|jgi:hypothetical protein